MFSRAQLVSQPQKPKNIQQKTKQEQNEMKLPLRFKVTLAISLLILSLVIGVSVALMNYFQPRIVISNNNKITHPDGSLHGIAQLQLIDKNLFQENLNMTLFMTYAVQQPKGRKLQAGNPNYLIHSLQPEIGITVRMSPLGNTSFFINQKQFQSFATKQIVNDRNLINPKVTSEKQYLQDLSLVFQDAIKQSTGIPNMRMKFDNITMAKLKIGSKSMGMEFDTSSDRLLISGPERNLFFGGILAIAKAVVPKVAGFLVNTIRTHGPLIGKIAGGVIGGVGGFMVGGPMGAFQGAMTGMQFGEAIGSAASSLVNSCIPQGTLRISCTPQSIGSVMSRFGGSNSFSQIASNILPNIQGQISAANFNSMFGGIGNMFNSFQSRIPTNALSYFGLGSIIS